MEAVVLAAGSGVRFGGGKLMAPWRGGVLLEGALQAALAAPVRSVTVVTGADPRVASILRAKAPDARLVDAPDHSEGLAASLRAAIRAVPADAAGVLVLLGDMPRVPHDVLAPLCGAVLAGAPAAAPIWNGRRGNPVALARELFPALLALEGDVGARSILDSLGDKLALVQAPSDGVLFDVDLPQDLAHHGH